MNSQHCDLSLTITGLLLVVQKLHYLLSCMHGIVRRKLEKTQFFLNTLQIPFPKVKAFKKRRVSSDKKKYFFSEVCLTHKKCLSQNPMLSCPGCPCKTKLSYLHTSSVISSFVSYHQLLMVPSFICT